MHEPPKRRERPAFFRRKRKKRKDIGGFSRNVRPTGKKRRFPLKKMLAAALVCVALGCAVRLGMFAFRWLRTSQTERELSALHAQTVAAYTEASADAAVPTPEWRQIETPLHMQTALPTPTPDIVRTTRYQRLGGEPLEQMEKLHEQNHDLVAWVTIDGVLDEPVVYRDNRYYLTHDFYQNASSAGTIFLDEDHPMGERTQNLLLHGHNMRDGTKFGRLTQYEKSVEYLKEHPFIEFSSLWHQENYVIFSVMVVSLDTQSGRFIEYFAHPTFANDREFEEYIRRAQLNSLYAVALDIQPSDALLTLSTCMEEERLVILARRQREDESRSELRRIIQMAVRN